MDKDAERCNPVYVGAMDLQVIHPVRARTRLDSDHPKRTLGGLKSFAAAELARRDEHPAIQ
jgi:hypothetical protein